jgi:ribosomal protein S27E
VADYKIASSGRIRFFLSCQQNLKHLLSTRIKKRKIPMQCDKCRNKAVIFQPSSGRHLCGRHLAADIETRAKRAIRSHRWMKTGDHIAVVVSGDKKSAALLYFLKKLTTGRRDIRVSTVPAGYREAGRGSRYAALRVTESLQIPCIGMPRPGRPGSAGENGVTKLALAFTLDDIAREVLVQFLSGNAEKLVHPPVAGRGGIPVICPFIAILSDELDIYWDREGTRIDLLPGPPVRDPLSRDVEALFRDYQYRHPATRFALMNLAEELSGGNVERIAAAGSGRDGPGSRGTLREVPCDGA